MQKVSIKHVNNQHSDWLRALDFYKQELDILKNRLNEVASKNTGNDVMKNVEHYENAINIQRNNIDTLSHDIRENIAAISKQIQDINAGYIDSELHSQHDKLQDRFATEENVLKELRLAFNKFIAEWM